MSADMDETTTAHPKELEMTEGYTFSALAKYPVSLAIWHWQMGAETPVSGDKTATARLDALTRPDATK